MPSPANDASIADAEPLWRRIRPDWVVYDKNQSRLRPKSMAFQNYKGTDAMSVILASARADDPTTAISGKHSHYFLVEFSVGLARSLNQGVIAFNDPEEPGHHHVTGKKTGSVKDRLANGSAWRVAPPAGFDPDAAHDNSFES